MTSQQTVRVRQASKEASQARRQAGQQLLCHRCGAARCGTVPGHAHLCIRHTPFQRKDAQLTVFVITATSNCCAIAAKKQEVFDTARNMRNPQTAPLRRDFNVVLGCCGAANKLGSKPSAHTKTAQSSAHAVLSMNGDRHSRLARAAFTLFLLHTQFTMRVTTIMSVTGFHLLRTHKPAFTISQTACSR